SPRGGGAHGCGALRPDLGARDPRRAIARYRRARAGGDRGSRRGRGAPLRACAGDRPGRRAGPARDGDERWCAAGAGARRGRVRPAPLPADQPGVRASAADRVPAAAARTHAGRPRRDRRCVHPARRALAGGARRRARGKAHRVGQGRRRRRLGPVRGRYAARPRGRHVRRPRYRRRPPDLLRRGGAAMTEQAPRRLPRRLIGWGLALVTVVVVMVNQRGVGIARDEVVYIQNGTRYAGWWIGLVTFDHGITERSVTQTFGGPSPTDNNREHPALMKTLFGLSEQLLHGRLGVTDEVTASRLPSALLAGVAVLLVYVLVLELWGLAEAIVSALVLMLLPRALFHAGLACFAAPTMTLWFATVYAYWRGLDGRRWPWQAGVAWGLALATKHTALLLPFALGAHYLIVAWRAQRQAGSGLTVRAVIGFRWRVIVSLVVLGPLTLYLVWPWLWFDPVRHVRDWLAFHTGHVHYNYEYLGRNWNAPRFPWHVPLVTTLFTVPVATLAAAIAGAGAWVADRARHRRHAPGTLLALSAAASIGPFFLGTTPIFGAEKHWMPVLPSICIAAGVGVVWAARGVAGIVG